MSSESDGQNLPSTVEENQSSSVEEPGPPSLETPAEEEVVVVDNVQGDEDKGQSLGEEVQCVK